MKLQSINFVKQWIERNPDAEVAPFVAAILNAPALDGDKLSAIQRSFEPLDDAGTLRMMVDRKDVELLLLEVLRLRAAAAVNEPVKEVECHVQAAPIADAQQQSSEPAPAEQTALDISDAENATTARQASKSRRRM